MVKRLVVVGLVALVVASCDLEPTTTTSVAAETTTTVSSPVTTADLGVTSTTLPTPPELSVDTTLSGPDLAWHSVAVEVPNVTVAGYVTPGSIVSLVVAPSSAAEDPTFEGVATVEGDYFYGDVLLAPGWNTVSVIAEGGGGSSQVDVEMRHEPEAEIEFGFLTQVSDSEIVADYAQWLTGDAANQAAYEDGVIGTVEEGVPNGYYIRNVASRLRTLPLDGDVDVWLVTPAGGPIEPIEVGIDEWLALFNDGVPWDYETDEVPPELPPHFGYMGAGTVFSPYWMILLDGDVIAIEQQYIP